MNAGDQDERNKFRSENISVAYYSAMELISYLSSEGKLTDDVAIAELFSILEKAREGTLGADEEYKFWKAYSQLAELAKPIEVDALGYRSFIMCRSIADKNAEKRYERNKINIARIRALSIASFVCTLFLLAYLALADGYLSRNDSLDQEFKLIRAGLFQGTRLEEIYNQSRNTALRAQQDQSDFGGGENDDQQVEGSDAILRALREGALSEIGSQIISNNKALAFLQLDWSREENNRNASTAPLLTAQYSVKDLKVESFQRSINLLVSTYLLPVFTSMLGVTVYILRRTSKNINSGQFRLFETGTYSYRITLGIIGGIVISWFTRTTSGDVVSSLTPAALAFIVGYSIEVLYNVLDSIVKALGASGREST